MEILITILSLIVYIAILVLLGFFIFWIVRFLVQVPKYLKHIAEALEEISYRLSK